MGLNTAYKTADCLDISYVFIVFFFCREVLIEFLDTFLRIFSSTIVENILQKVRLFLIKKLYSKVLVGILMASKDFFRLA